MSKKRKVVMIGADRSVKGGVSAVVNNYYKAGLDRRVDLTYIGTMVDGSKLKKACKAAGALARFILAMPGTDIVHVNMAADASCLRKLLFMRVARLFRKRIIIHEHGGDFQGFYYERCGERLRRTIRKDLNRAELFFVASEEWEQFFAQIVSPEKIHVLENGVPIPEAGKKDYSSHSVLFLGRLCKEKGIGELLAAVPEIRKAVPDFKLILGGFWEKGSDSLKERAEAFSDVVSCPGWVGEKERDELFSQCSIFVLPTWFEGQPVSLLEAMAAGMCVAASAVGGIPRILSGEGTGILLEPENAEKLASDLVCLLQDENRRAEYGRKARLWMMKHHDVNGIVEQLAAFYESVMEKETKSAD